MVISKIGFEIPFSEIELAVSVSVVLLLIQLFIKDRHRETD